MRSRPSLFEVINKAPETQDKKEFRKILGFKRRSAEAPPQIVAEALTEEEAAAEIAAREAEEAEQRRLAEEAAREKQARIDAKRAQRAEKKAAKLAAREAARIAAAELAASGQVEPQSPVVRFTQGRMTLSLGTLGCILVAAGASVMILGAYTMGRRSAAEGPANDLPKAAAVTRVDDSHVIPAPMEEPPKPKPDPVTPRPAADSGTRANQPAKVVSTTPVPTDKALNYVVIDWFAVTNRKKHGTVKKELADARRFLLEHGIETFARRFPKGYRLFAMHGFSMGSDFEDKRNGLRKRIEQLGADYRRSGGLYQFKDCYFASYGHATEGRPVTFEE